MQIKKQYTISFFIILSMLIAAISFYYYNKNCFPPPKKYLPTERLHLHFIQSNKDIYITDANLKQINLTSFDKSTIIKSTDEHNITNFYIPISGGYKFNINGTIIESKQNNVLINGKSLNYERGAYVSLNGNVDIGLGMETLEVSTYDLENSPFTLKPFYCR